jgi:ATP-dependent Lhr-like helicase
VLYVSPLRALAVDVEKNLRSPLAGIQHAAERLGAPLAHVPTVGVRTGDTDARERRRLLRDPPDILITTPESLYLMLTSSARETLRGITTVIVDEIHAIAATKRGAHLMLSLERLEAEVEQPFQRIGLSATQRPLDEIARFLGGLEAPGRPRDVAVVDAGVRKPLDLEVIVPVEDMAELGRPVDEQVGAGLVQPGGSADRMSIWPSIHPVLLDLIRRHRSTIVFVNNRRTAERLAAKLNELAEEDLARAHHGSLAREQRVEVEDALKAGRLRAIVATSSLELGIDMGAVDLVIQVESPKSVARGLQRVGRAGHDLHSVSKGRIAALDMLGSIQRALQQTQETAPGETPFTNLATDLNIGQKRLDLSGVLLDSPVLRLTGSGAIGFDQALNFDLQALVTGAPARLVNRLTRSEQTDEALVPVKVAGTVNSPQVRPDVKKLATGAVEGLFKSLLKPRK